MTAPSPACLFCQIIDGRISSSRVYETAEIVGFKDAHPQAPVHVLFVPTRHLASLDELARAGLTGLGDHLFEAALRVARELGVHKNGYRLVLNCRADGGQTVDHLHLHLLGGRRMTWPPG